MWNKIGWGIIVILLGVIAWFAKGFVSEVGDMSKQQVIYTQAAKDVKEIKNELPQISERVNSNAIAIQTLAIEFGSEKVKEQIKVILQRTAAINQKLEEMESRLVHQIEVISENSQTLVKNVSDFRVEFLEAKKNFKDFSNFYYASPFIPRIYPKFSAKVKHPYTWQAITTGFAQKLGGVGLAVETGPPSKEWVDLQEWWIKRPKPKMEKPRENKIPEHGTVPQPETVPDPKTMPQPGAMPYPETMPQPGTVPVIK